MQNKIWIANCFTYFFQAYKILISEVLYNDIIILSEKL